MRPKGVIVVEDALPGARPAHAPYRLAASEQIANRPIAHHVLDSLESAGVEDVVVASSVELASHVRECLGKREGRTGLRVRYVEHGGALDVPAAVKLAAPIVGAAPCVVHYASGLVGEPLAPFVDALRADSADVLVIVHQSSTPNERLSTATQEMLHLADLDPTRAALCMAGVWLFGPGALEYVASSPWRSGAEVDLTIVAERIAAAGGSFDLRLVDAWRRYAGDPLDLLELNRIALDRLEAGHRPRNNGNRIEGRVRIHESASVRASVIVGPAVVDRDARIADAYIGPYTSVGAGAHIEGAEIERSIISAGASIMHVGGRLAASVVGRDARVFREFSLPRAMRLQVGDRTEVALY
jgi:glucose-1-phosphate thymidylyltransferase